MKLSLIIPVYNAERYLRACLDSVLNQDFVDLELLCVDDASTDGSRRILADYASRDGRVRVLDNKGSGAGGARNTALKVATGEYVQFIDADDLLCERALSTVCAKADAEASDIVVFEADEYDDVTHWKTRLPMRMRQGLTDSGRLCSFSTAPWNKLYRLDFIREKGLIFQETPRTNDLAFVCEAFCCTDRIGFVNKPLYLYRINNGSSLQSTKRCSPTTFIDALDELRRRLEARGLFARFAISYGRLVENMVQTNLYSSGSYDIHRELLDILRARGFTVRGNRSYLSYALARLLTSIRYRGFVSFAKHALGRIIRKVDR